MTGLYGYIGTGHEINEQAAWDYIHDGYLLAPRTVLEGRTKLPQPELPVVSIDLNKTPFIVEQIFASVMGDMTKSRRAIMFSGGFDSMLTGLLARQCGARVTAVTIQFDDFNPITVEGSMQLAHQLGIDHHILHVKSAEFLSAFETVAGITDEPVLDLDLVVVYAALKKYDIRISGDVFISGMGSDQWFGNMALEPWPGGFASRMDWAHVNQDSHQRVAQVYGCKFIFPFLSRPMLSLSQSVPLALKKDKKLLRGMAVANAIAHQGIRSEVQVPALMRHILIKMYGDRAWPSAVSSKAKNSRGNDRILRQIILGLWLEKNKGRMAGS